MPPDDSPVDSPVDSPPVELDLSQPRRVHVVGVAGAGMSAIALVLARMGHTVSGSDIKSSAVLERLAAAGVAVNVGNRAEYVPANADAVVYSTAIPLRNVELRTAIERGIPVLHRAAALGGARRHAQDDRRRGLAREDDERVDARPDPAPGGVVAELRDRR